MFLLRLSFSGCCSSVYCIVFFFSGSNVKMIKYADDLTMSVLLKRMWCVERVESFKLLGVQFISINGITKLSRTFNPYFRVTEYTACSGVCLSKVLYTRIIKSTAWSRAFYYLWNSLYRLRHNLLVETWSKTYLFCAFFFVIMFLLGKNLWGFNERVLLKWRTDTGTVLTWLYFTW